MSILKSAIEKFGSQSKLASEIGCSQQVVSKWLKDGSVSPKFALILSAKINVPVEKILSEGENNDD